MSAKQFTLVAVQAISRSSLRLTYADGAIMAVDLETIIREHQTLSRLVDPAVFSTATLGAWGASVAWGNDDYLELAADNLRARAVEQAGGYSHEVIWNWMARHQLTLEAAAQALGLSRRMLAYYRSGEKPLPRTVALACLGWEVENRLAA